MEKVTNNASDFLCVRNFKVTKENSKDDLYYNCAFIHTHNVIGKFINIYHATPQKKFLYVMGKFIHITLHRIRLPRSIINNGY